MKFNMKNAPNVIWTVVAAVVLISVFIEGMYLPGAPKANKVSRVTISYPAVTEEVKEFTDPENISQACKLMDTLKYVPFKSAKGRLENAITIEYHLKNGSTKTVIADKELVLWGGKNCVLKDDEAFVELATATFFAEEAAVVD